MARFIRIAAQAIFLLCTFLLLGALPTRTAFESGERYTFYLESPSSQAEIVSCDGAQATFFKYFYSDRVTGESTVYSDGETSVEEIEEKYGARVLFSEECDSVRSYYCYAQGLGRGIDLGGVTVNLHIAEGRGKIAVGTPLIFGGF